MGMPSTTMPASLSRPIDGAQTHYFTLQVVKRFRYCTALSGVARICCEGEAEN